MPHCSGSRPISTPERLTRNDFLVPALCAAVAGFADGDAYLRWHQFAANMTGNTVLLGLAATSGHLRAIGIALAPIFAFIVGSALAEALGRRRAWLAIVIEAVLLAAASFAGVHRWQLGLVAVTMGIQNTAIASINPLAPNTSFVTGDYGRIGQAALRLVRRTDAAKARSTLVVMIPLVFRYAIGAAIAAACLARNMPHALLVTLPLLAVVVVSLRRS